MRTHWFLLLVCALLSTTSCQDTANSSGQGLEEGVSMSERSMKIFDEIEPERANRGQYRIYYQADSPAAGALDAIEEQLKASKAQTLAMLQRPSYTDTIHVLLVDSEAKLEELVGMREAEFTNPNDRFSIVAFDGEKKAFFTQAIFKQLSFYLWGAPGDPVLFEGGASFAQGYCQGIIDPINTIPAQALREGKVCTIRALLFDFRECWTAHPTTSRMQAASVFQLLYTGFELDVVERIWKAGLPRIEKTIGMSPTDLTQEWERHMTNVTLQDLDLDAINAQGCR